MTRQSDDRRVAVLRALREADSGVSGEALAVALGVSRVAVRKHIGALCEAGWVIEARRGEGYRLVQSPDAPVPLVVGPLLTSRFFTRLEGGASTGSTNDDARDLARAGAPEGTVVLAACQTGGRGRLGRSWTSPTGGVYASIVLRPQVETPDAIVLPLVVGLGVARGLSALGADARLKWPNDLLDDGGRKVGGVLLEGLSEGWRLSWVVAGIGVNVRRGSADRCATSVDELVGREVPLGEAAAAVLDAVAATYETWRDNGFAPLLEEYDARAWLTGREVTVSDAAGAVIASGTVSGMDSVGRLLVDGGNGRVAVVAGDVTLRDPARPGGCTAGGA